MSKAEALPDRLSPHQSPDDSASIMPLFVVLSGKRLVSPLVDDTVRDESLR